MMFTRRKSMSLRNSPSQLAIDRISGSTLRYTPSIDDNSPLETYLMKFALPMSKQEQQQYIDKFTEKRRNSELLMMPILEQLNEIEKQRRVSMQLSEVHKTNFPQLKQRRSSFDIDIQISQNIINLRQQSSSKVEQKSTQSLNAVSPVQYIKGKDDKYTFFQKPLTQKKSQALPQSGEATSPGSSIFSQESYTSKVCISRRKSKIQSELDTPPKVMVSDFTEFVRERASTDTRRPVCFRKYLYPIILEKNEEQLKEIGALD